ncbi:hypothetical protein [Streptomyces sp. AS02]|uniref:hypothetical protein n=1 Tax=Streptomyces sp. AS02 TaxID=2938946 RepID=UPI0020215368|nr:hypothetical protein [Streptomyces sp. AS02]MCL8013392.1 hypothetical protein [Streptomyces sp. AS02]
MISRTRRLLLAGMVGAVVAGGTALATAAPSAAPRAAEAQPPVAVEDFSYPGADRILAEQGISLKRGDGHITLATCNEAADQIKVLTRVGGGEFCFAATHTTGHLTLELPDVFAIQTESHPVRAELTAEGKSQTVEVPKNNLKGVGEGLGEPPTVLLEIRVTG